MKNYINFITENKLFEIATIIEPNIIVNKADLTRPYFEFKVGDDIYWVKIFLYNIDKCSDPYDDLAIDYITDLTTIKIDFDLKTEKSNKVKITNKNMPLQVLGNVMGCAKYWTSLNLNGIIGDGEYVELKDVVISHVCLGAKCENDEDLRRSNIYNYYFEKFINSKVINKKRTKEENKEFSFYMIDYEIEPTNIRNILKT